VLLTGHAGHSAALATDGTFSLLRKPVSATQLTDHLRTLLAARARTGG